jgi:hypothetical protein
MMPSAWLGLPFEPFLSDVTEPDRVAGLRAFAVLIAVHCGSDHPAVSALRCAEMDASTSSQALIEFDRLPALKRRKIILTYARVISPPRQRGGA